MGLEGGFKRGDLSSKLFKNSVLEVHKKQDLRTRIIRAKHATPALETRHELREQAPSLHFKDQHSSPSDAVPFCQGNGPESKPIK
jgi:hypothetical protein